MCRLHQFYSLFYFHAFCRFFDEFEPDFCHSKRPRRCFIVNFWLKGNLFDERFIHSAISSNSSYKYRMNVYEFINKYTKYNNKISHIMKSVKYLFFDDFWSLISPLHVVLFESNIFAFWSSSNGTSLVSFIVGPRDPRTACFAHRSVRVCAIFFGFYLVDAGFRRFSGFDALWSEFLGNFVVQFLWILCYIFIAHLMAVLFRHIYYDSQRCVGFTGFIAFSIVMKIGKIETSLESWSVHYGLGLTRPVCLIADQWSETITFYAMKNLLAIQNFDHVSHIFAFNNGWLGPQDIWMISRKIENLFLTFLDY